MRFDDDSESSNIEDRRGSGLPIGGRSIGIGTAVLALAAWYFGIDPSVVMNGLQGVAPPQTQVDRPSTTNVHSDQMAHFVGKVLKSTEITWQEIFRQSGKEYINPKLVLFSGATNTACGTGQTAMGPFYCPNDQRVYIDLAFYDELQRRFKAPGDFAQAYVIAHEVGHHVQNLLGISDTVQQMRDGVSEAQSNALSVRLELQADCFAGVWANRADSEHRMLEAGDVEEALDAAAAIGDDTLQKSGQGYVVPETFTHGTSTQRVRWFKRGFQNGSVDRCNTFKTREL